MELEQARLDYRKGKITFDELNKVFDEKVSEKEKQQFWECHVFDRAGFIMGKSQKELDNEWNSIIGG